MVGRRSGGRAHVNRSIDVEHRRASLRRVALDELDGHPSGGLKGGSDAQHPYPAMGLARCGECTAEEASAISVCHQGTAEQGG